MIALRKNDEEKSTAKEDESIAKEEDEGSALEDESMAKKVEDGNSPAKDAERRNVFKGAIRGGKRLEEWS